MKKSIISLFFSLFATMAICQQKQDVVYLKNGSVIRGDIIEQVPNESLKIQTEGRSVFVYKFDEIEKITKEDKAPPGGTMGTAGQLGFGVAIGGGGILGVPVRYQVADELYLEAGLFYRPALVTNSYTDEVEVVGGLALAGGLNYFLKNKTLEHKSKHRKHGLFFKAGHSFSTYTENFVAAGWVSETFKFGNQKGSFIFELGPGIVTRPWVDDPENFRYDDGVSKIGPLIYWKLHWNWYR